MKKKLLLTILSCLLLLSLGLLTACDGGNSPADTTAEQTTESPTEPAKGGCGSMIGLSVLLTLGGAALMLRKKKED